MTNNNNKLHRIVIVDQDRCRPQKCGRECEKSCPVVRMGKLCIDVYQTSKIAFISENLCIGCGICVRKCPFKAIQIVNVPIDLESYAIHRYGPNSFKLFRLPSPQSGHVLGLIGANGLGKSTVLKILAAKLKPNLGKLGPKVLDWPEVFPYLNDPKLVEHFESILFRSKKVVLKPQYIDMIPRAVTGNVNNILDSKDERKVKDAIVTALDLQYLLFRDTDQMAGGELQRFAVAVTVLQQADVYMFDEPTSYVDIRQRVNIGKVIRELISPSTSVLVIDHDLSFVDYVSDLVCCLYGSPGAYGVVTMPFSARQGIDVFLDGILPDENIRFREASISFKGEPESEYKEEDNAKYSAVDYSYPELTKVLAPFKLTVLPGTVSPGEVIAVMGENGVGKTTFLRMLAGSLNSDNQATVPQQFSVSYKPQKIAPRFQGTVEQLFQARINDAFIKPQFLKEVIKPLRVDKLLQQEIQHLSGSELQRVALVMFLGKKADVYLLDEPSAYMDCEYRIIAARIIKRFMRRNRKIAFVVDHDFTMALYLADRVIVYEGEPGHECTASSPVTVVSGMNKFLKTLEVTAGRDPTSYRPRINKLYSMMDQQQKESGTLFYED